MPIKGSWINSEALAAPNDLLVIQVDAPIVEVGPIETQQILDRKLSVRLQAVEAMEANALPECDKPEVFGKASALKGGPYGAALFFNTMGIGGVSG